MARRSRGQRIARGLAAGAAVAGGLAAVVAIGVWKPFEHDRPYPDAWPAAVQPLAEFVDGASGLKLRHPVTIRFLGDDEFRDELGAWLDEQPGRSDEEVAADDAIGRAVGFLAGDQSSAVPTLSLDDEATAYPVRRRPDRGDIIVRADPDEDLPVRIRAALVLVLAQEAQSQQFDIAAELAETRSIQERNALYGITVGHSVWVSDRYVATLDDDEQQEYFDGFDPSIIGDVPPAEQAFQVAPQVFGALLSEAIRQHDRRGFDTVFGSERPTALDQLALPVSKYFRRDETERVAAPDVPRDGRLVRTGQMGIVGTYLMLATGTAAHDALAAADGWGNDAYTAYELDGRVCVDVHLVADSRADADRLDRALRAWAVARPESSDALVGRDGTSLYASACDPGPDVEQPTPDDIAVAQLLQRAVLMRAGMDDALDAAVGECVWLDILHRYDIDEVLAPQSSDDDLTDVILAREAFCKAKTL